MRSELAAWAVGVSWAIAGAAFGQFTAIPRGVYFQAGARTLSADGRVAAGFGTSSQGANVPFVWTAEGGRYDFGLEPGFPVGSSDAFGISGDGSTVVGSVYSSQGTTLAYRWSPTGGYQSLGTLGGFLTRSFAWDTSRDGTIVVGHAIDRFDGMSEPFIWSEDRGIRSLGRAFGRSLNQAIAVSDDGGTVVGWSVGGFDFGWTWTEETGYHPLAALAGTNGSSYATAANGDASIIVGNAGRESYSAMWREDEVVSLGSLPGTRFYPAAVDDLGSVVVGFSWTNSGDSFATIWTPQAGTRPFADYLVEQGVTLPVGVLIAACTSVSADGRTFAGAAYMADVPNSIFAYVLTVPSPATLAVAFGGLMLPRRRREMHPKHERRDRKATGPMLSW